MPDAAIYARFSSALQKPTSIVDQVALCRGAAARLGWEVLEEHVYADEELSGAVADRPGYQTLLEAARRKAFDVVLVEAQDRLWRDQGELHSALKLLRFLGVRVYSVETGSDLTDQSGRLVASVKGLMDETFLETLREKTRRGMAGAITRGFSAGGRPYGYTSGPIADPARRDAYGNPLVLGYRRVVRPDEAEVVLEIFTRYAEGMSPKSIALDLNERGIAPPRWRHGAPLRGWTWTTINGCPKKGIGILNNSAYIGKLVWNRSYKIRDPDAPRKRVTRPRDPSEWVMADVPELRIVPDELWERVQRRREAMRRAHSQAPRRPKYLFSGMLVCAVCGAPYIIKTGGYYGCASNINRGRRICPNTQLARRDVLETRVVDVIRREVFGPEEVAEIAARVNELAQAQARVQTGGRRAQLLLEQADLARRIDNLIDAIGAGGTPAEVVERLRALSARKAQVEALLRPLEEPPAPVSEERIRGYMARLRDTLAGDVEEAKGLIRQLLEPIQLRPSDDGLVAVLQGSIQGLLGLGRTAVRYDGAGAGRAVFPSSKSHLVLVGRRPPLALRRLRR